LPFICQLQFVIERIITVRTGRGTTGRITGLFTGFLHQGEKEYVFAVNVRGKDQWGWQARTLLIDVLQDMR